MSETVKLILSLSVSGGLFALALFALKPLMRNRLSKSFQYYIWLVVLLRFIVPFSFGINLMEMDLVSETSHALSKARDAITDFATTTQTVETVEAPPGYFDEIFETPINDEYVPPIIQPVETLETTGNKVDLVKLFTDNLLWIWLAGATISATWNILGYLRFICYVHGAAYAVEMPGGDLPPGLRRKGL